MEINRHIINILKADIFSGKAILLLGARQTGKTTALKRLVKSYENILWLNADEADVRDLFEHPSATMLRVKFEGYRIVVIDEAQRIENIGIKLKLITDEISDLQLIVTGSSAFELSNTINEPLTGRKWEHKLYPLSFSEMVNHHGSFEEKKLLSHRLVFGYYPEVVTSTGNEKRVLTEIANSFLYKDILQWEGIKKPDKLVKIMQALAFQIGSQVSFHEIAQLVGLDNQTVEKYIQLLEQTFVIFRLNSFSRNLRNELKKSRKIYFYDNGIRNSLISNFNSPGLRQDTGQLWENFIISERQKQLNYKNIYTNAYFWRTLEKQEIDYIEERDGKLFAYEFKWNPIKQPRLSKTFSRAYPKHEYKVISPDNFEEFIYQQE